MTTNDVKLNKLVLFVKELADNNDWFRDQLLNAFSNGDTLNMSSKNILESKINLIQEYLAIDLQDVIDYSGFGEPSREQLFRDCLEMGRFKRGTPNHKVDFGEFCRYAHLQSEEMINYFLTKKSNSSISVILDFVKENVPKFTQSNVTNVHHITFSNKFTALKSVLNLSKRGTDALWFLSKVRNEQSHRNSSSRAAEDEVLELFEQAGYLKGGVNFSRMSPHQMDIFNNGTFIIKKREMDFKSIYDTIDELKIQVLNADSRMMKLPSSKSNLGDLHPGLQELRNQMLSND